MTRYGIWEELRVIRRRTGYTLTQLSADSGIRLSMLSMLENGHRWPTATATKKLSETLKVPYTMLERPQAQQNPEAS